jgi:hypothetical protein
LVNVRKYQKERKEGKKGKAMSGEEAKSARALRGSSVLMEWRMETETQREWDGSSGLSQIHWAEYLYLVSTAPEAR